MFIIMPKNPADWQQAMFMLSYYHVRCTLYSNGEDAKSVYMEVRAPRSSGDDGEDALHLAEMCFQMNWHQGGMICPGCHKEQNNYWAGCDGKDTCGHLTFTHPTDSSAFDRAMGIS